MLVSFDLPDHLGKMLNKIAKENHVSQTKCMIDALQGYIQDRIDYKNAQKVRERIESGKEELYTLEETRKKLGLKKKNLG